MKIGKEMEHFFETYKKVEGKRTDMFGWRSANHA